MGVIPKDWDFKQIGEIAVVSSGGTPSRNNPSYWNGNIPWITTTQIDFNTIISSNEFITEHGLKNSAAKLYAKNTLLMAMYGQGKTRGKVAILGIEATINQACAAIIINKDISNNYVFFYLAHNYEEIRKLSNTGNQENLNGNIIKSIVVPIPPLTEQEAIAQSLSDVDAQITALDQLITKKRNIKQSTMQQLLTGKKRLPSFSKNEVGMVMEKTISEGYKQTELGVIPNDWDVQLVGQCFEVCNNLRYPISEEVRKKKLGEYPYYGPTRIQGYIDEYRVEGEYALIGEDGDHFLKWRELPMTLLVKGKFNVNNHAHLVKGTKNLTEWFYYYFYHRELTPYLTRQGAGRYKLTKNALLQIPCAIPPTIKEQKAIASVLQQVENLH